MKATAYDQFVEISASGKQLEVNRPEVKISKHNGDQVKWKSTVLNVTVTVNFTNSPFKESTFSVDTTGATPSGPVKDSANAGGTRYKYSLTAPGYNPLDPNVIVDN
ncbi:MAG: hypothetical protein JOY79_10815 [Acidobacteriaceae bacterium]|nr:hypothetical protein [Acidobacteriaceae bacterium]